jgi:membrane protein DedA with SNARE-associated domain
MDQEAVGAVALILICLAAMVVAYAGYTLGELWECSPAMDRVMTCVILLSIACIALFVACMAGSVLCECL